MKKKAILIIVIIITSVSLVGIVLTQLYWVKKSLDLKSEQFDNSVRIALKSVINQLMEIKNDSVFQEHLYELSCRKAKLDVTDVIVPATLDSLMRRELGSMGLGEQFYYGIYNAATNKFSTGQYGKKEGELVRSPYRFSISSIYKPGDYSLIVYFPTKTSLILRQMEIWLLMSVLFLIVVIISFGYVVFRILQQRRLSELKSDFVNNMTHEFKTPLATSSLAAEMLLRPDIAKNGGRINRYAQVILDENVRLQNHVEQILQATTQENGKQHYQFTRVDIHEMIKLIATRFELRIKENKVNLILHLDAPKHVLTADKNHILNMLFNMVDNAIKYSPEKPKIVIKTWNNRNGIIIRIRDNGIGIRSRHHKDIFKNLFRVPTGNIHEVRGFGLGLFYVKNVVNRHHGVITVDSEPGNGSAFDIFLPFSITEK